ncbi:MAG: NADH-quinone oxidoreductase subunit L [Gemmataceae bacterium]|nr:NADH-quinone oxidoreductase subunit L [Gemmataceae bacterium]
MLDWFEAAPGRLYVVATLLPLGAFALLLVAGAVKNLCRPARQEGGRASSVYWLLGGDHPLRAGAYLATALMAVSAALAVGGLVWFLRDADQSGHAARWAERVEWVRVGPPAGPHDAPRPAAALELGYRIDHLSAILFAMVTVVGTLIFVFSLGYMADEAGQRVEDHEVDRQTPRPGHFARRGRYGRFFLYLSLFAFSMLNLLIADNLFQVFVGWELVGVCSFFLVGFFYERPSAARAANKAFIVNRVGDAGFLVGIFVAWSALGTLNIEELTRRVRPEANAGTLTRADPGSPAESARPIDRPGSDLLLYPAAAPAHRPGEPARPPEPDGSMPYTLFVLMGLGIFLGCVGKSAQIPLHTWLPDAMEGPTPVSALIHAATMVAAGVYLVGRAFPLFAPEVLLVIAYTGAATLFVSATIALVQTDIKRVLAYSTCSQLGYMMLALGVGGWVAGLLHLVTHAFFKALLFLGSGSVIHGCHHEQDLRKMGGLFGPMKVTALTMLVGVLAISGAPFFSGWYSKDQIIASALGYGLVHKEHVLLFLLPLVGAGLTGFYMFRLWFLAFAGRPRDEHVHHHAHESPRVMTLPLVVLAVFSVGVAWGSPPWDADASYLGHLLHDSEPAAADVPFAEEHHEAHEVHLVAGVAALVVALLGAGLAAAMYWRSVIDPAAIRNHVGGVYAFLRRKWYFDEVYDAAVVNPTVGLAFAAAAADKRPTDGPADAPPRRFDLLTLDGLLTAVGQLADTAGRGLRTVQTGRLRGYVVALALTVVLLLGMLWGLTSQASGGR